MSFRTRLLGIQYFYLVPTVYYIHTKSLSITNSILLRFQCLVQTLDSSFLEMPSEPAAILLNILEADHSHPLRTGFILSKQQQAP